MLNSMGLGIVLTAKDMASGVISKVRGEFERLGTGALEDGMRFKSGMTEFATGAAMMGAGVAVLKTTLDLAKGASNFETAIAEVSTLVDEAVFPIQKMRDVTLELTETYGGSATAQAKALYQTISAGVTDAAKATELLHVANKLAVGGVTSVETAVDGLTSVVNAFSSTGATATDVADAFFVAIKAGKTDATQLSGNIGMVAPVAASLGVSFSDLLGAISAITTQGVQTSVAVSGLKAALANVLKPTADAEKEAKRLGIEFNASSLRAKGLSGFLDMITSSAGYNQDSLTELFGSVEALGAITNLTAGDSAKFNEILAGMEGRAGAAGAAFEKMAGTAGFQWGKLRGLIEVTLIKIGGWFLPIFKTIGSVFGKVIEKIRAGWELLPEPVRQFLSAIQPVVGTLLPVIGMLLATGGAIKMLTGLTKMFGIAMKTLGVVGTATSVALKTTLIGLLITGAILVIQHWDEIKPVLVAIGEAVKEVGAWFVNTFTDISDAVTDAWNSVMQWGQNVREQWLRGIDELHGAIVKTIDWFTSLPGAAWRVLKGIGEAVVKFFTETIPAAVDRAMQSVSNFIRNIPVIGGAADWFYEGVKGFMVANNQPTVLPTATPSAAAPTTAPMASPGIAAITATAAASAASRPSAAPETPSASRRTERTEQVTHVHVAIDGREVAEAVDRRRSEQAALGFDAVPAEG